MRKVLFSELHGLFSWSLVSVNSSFLSLVQRCPLESIVLHAKQLDLGEPREILSLALQPPNLDDIERTILSLKEVVGTV